MQKRIDPSFLRIRTMGLLQGEVEGVMIPLSSILATSASASVRLAKGRRLAGCLMGRDSPVLIRCLTRLVCPRSFLSWRGCVEHL